MEIATTTFFKWFFLFDVWGFDINGIDDGAGKKRKKINAKIHNSTSKGELANEMIIPLFFRTQKETPFLHLNLKQTYCSQVFPSSYAFTSLKSQEMIFPSVSLYMEPSPAKGLIFLDLNLKVSLPSFPFSLFKSPHLLLLDSHLHLLDFF